MSKYINLIAFGTFGNPNGFKQTFFQLSDIAFARNVKTFDLKTDAIKLFPKSEIYAIRKEHVNGNNSIAYSIYTFAKEQNSDRGGTFIGSSILFINKIADEAITVKCLNEFHGNLINNNLQNDIIIVNHSDKLIAGKPPKDFNTLELNLKEVPDLNFFESSNQNLVVYSMVNPGELEQLFKKSIDLLNVYDTIYFTSNKEVAEFVLKRDIFKLVQLNGFEQEIKKLQDQKKQKCELLISEFGKEKQRLEEDRKKIIEEFKKQIETNEKVHQENKRKIDESKSEINNINQKYEGYAKKIDESINKLKSGNKLEAVRQFYNDNKKIFIESVNQQQKPKYLNNISKPNTKTALKADFQSRQSSEQDSFENENTDNEKNGYEIDIFKVISFLLFLLLMGTLLLYFNKKNKVVAVQPEQSNVAVNNPPVPEKPNIEELSPKPDTVLSENDYLHVAKKIKKGMKLEEVVQIIFDANPTDIKNTYLNQVEQYSKRLLELNQDCFQLNSNTFLLIKDTLINIPSYKNRQ